MTFDGKACHQRLKNEARMRGMTLRELAAYAGVSENSIQTIKQQTQQGPSALTVMRLAKALRRDPNWVMGWERAKHEQL
jgi:transcriptional regulator with XRE-family HTH domain